MIQLLKLDQDNPAPLALRSPDAPWDSLLLMVQLSPEPLQLEDWLAWHHAVLSPVPR